MNKPRFEMIHLQYLRVDDKYYLPHGNGQLEQLAPGLVDAVRQLTGVAQPQPRPKAYLAKPPSGTLLATLRELAVRKTPIDKDELSTLAGCPSNTASARLSEMHSRGWLEYVPHVRPRAYLVVEKGFQQLRDLDQNYQSTLPLATPAT